VQTYNAISPVGLESFPENEYDIAADMDSPHAILLRSHKLQSAEVPTSVRAIARCGAGTNNIPVDEMTERGIPVFNTPGANANAVKELVIAGLLLSSRGITQGISHSKQLMEDITDQGALDKQVESDKKLFGGRELKGKTIGIIGLGHIGGEVAYAANELGMDVIGFDPQVSLEMAWKLPTSLVRLDSVHEMVGKCDYLSVHVPYIKDKTHHLLGKSAIQAMKPGIKIMNFARGEIVNNEALLDMLDANPTAAYVTDFPKPELLNHNQVVNIPHLGASSEEAEENSAKMAALTIRDYLEQGVIRNSVNFPNLTPDPRTENINRICIVNENIPGMLAAITQFIGDANLNISAHVNSSRGDVAFNVIDVEKKTLDDSVFDTWSDLQKALSLVEGVLSSRVLEGHPGTLFHVSDIETRKIAHILADSYGKKFADVSKAQSE
jgi:D-3-phosphoglycerate dehydrogenase